MSNNAVEVSSSADETGKRERIDLAGKIMAAMCSDMDYDGFDDWAGLAKKSLMAADALILEAKKQ